MRRKILHKILNWTLRRYFNALTEEDVFVTDPKSGIIYYKGRKLDPEYKEKLAGDADMIANSVLWKMLRNEGEYQANTKMFKTSGSDMDMLFGKAMLHSIKVLDKRLKQLVNLQ